MWYGVHTLKVCSGPSGQVTAGTQQERRQESGGKSSAGPQVWNHLESWLMRKIMVPNPRSPNGPKWPWFRLVNYYNLPRYFYDWDDGRCKMNPWGKWWMGCWMVWFMEIYGIWVCHMVFVDFIFIDNSSRPKMRTNMWTLVCSLLEYEARRPG